MRTPKTGKCHICGKDSKLSYEHIPPAKAFNKTSAKVYSALDIVQGGGLPWDVEGVPGKILQRGVGDYTLCIRCNSFTGAKYALDFINACQQAMNPEHVQIRSDISRARVSLLGIDPLNFGKQILSMFASVNGSDFFDSRPELRELVLNQDKYGINTKEYGLFMYLYRGGVGRNGGVSASMSMRGLTLSTELTTIPFGFVLILEPSRDSLPPCGTEITGILNDYPPGAVGDFLFELPIYAQNSPMPLDFRSRETILGKQETES